MKNWRRVRTTGKWTFGAQRALLGSRHKDNGKTSETHVDHFWKRLQRGPHARRCSDRVPTPLRDAHRQRKAHQHDLRSGPALDPTTWSAKPVPANPGWEGITWQGNNGVQSRPDHILLSVNLTAPPVTIYFRSSHTLSGTALASIDHASLRLTMQYRFRVRKQLEKPRRLDRAKLAAATTREAFHRGGRKKVGASELGQIEAFGSGGTPQLAHGKFYFQSSVDGIPRCRLAKEEALVEQRHDGSDQREEVVKSAAPWLRPAPLGALCFTSTRKARIWCKQWQYTDKNIFLRVLWLGLCCVLLESLQTESGTAAIKTNKSTSLGWRKTWIARTSSTTPGQCGNGIVTLQAQRLGREVGFLLLQTRVD